MVQHKQAFTLIELLVVVLIIGILAAVALPQYKLAVLKSQVAMIWPILNNLRKAQEVYYLANGEYSNDGSKLDITIPETCVETLDAKGDNSLWKCGDFLVDRIAGGKYDGISVAASYCPGKDTLAACAKSRDFQIHAYLNRAQHDSGLGCTPANSRGLKICNRLTFH